jgi:glucokinase
MPNFAIGVDLGGTSLRVAVVNESGELLKKITTPVKPLRTSERIIATMCQDIGELTRKFDGTGELLGIGIAIPGIIDMSAGILRRSPNLPGWQNVPVREEVERRLGATVVLDNDANAAVLGEYWIGSGREVESMFMYTLGTGVGGGVILNGSIWHGMTGMAGEPGHMTVSPDGPPCPCGNNGCVEQFAGATAILRKAHECTSGKGSRELMAEIRQNETFTVEDLFSLAAQGNEAAIKIFEGAGRALGTSVAAMINLLDLPLYVIGGGVAGGWSIFSPFILEEVERRSFVYRSQSPDSRAVITHALLGGDGGLFGAARMAMLASQGTNPAMRDRSVGSAAP